MSLINDPLQSASTALLPAPQTADGKAVEKANFQKYLDSHAVRTHEAQRHGDVRTYFDTYEKLRSESVYAFPLRA
jgi:hypothetical protein